MMPALLISRCRGTLARMSPLVGRRSAPMMESATKCFTPARAETASTFPWRSRRNSKRPCPRKKASS